MRMRIVVTIAKDCDAARNVRWLNDDSTGPTD